MNKDKTIEMLLNRIDLTIHNMPRNIKIFGQSVNLIEHIKFDFYTLDYELDLLIRVLNRVLKNGN